MNTDNEWFTLLRDQYTKEADSSRYATDELEVFHERSAFSFYEGLNPIWLMEHAERSALFLLMERIKPQVVIEIGSRYAGSTYIFSKYAKSVYVIDLDPEVEKRCQHLKNVNVLIGSSPTIIPSLLDKLRVSGENWDFALVDGDHSYEGVKQDLNALIKHRPSRRAWIAMHDSFNPVCRKGIKDADWAAPWVHHVELDFVPGQLMFQPHVKNQMWGGMSLAEIRPEDRANMTITLRENSINLYTAAYKASIHYKNPITRLVKTLMLSFRKILESLSGH